MSQRRDLRRVGAARGDLVRVGQAGRVRARRGRDAAEAVGRRAAAADSRCRSIPSSAVIVDLPGAEAVHAGLLLAERGFWPVPLFNGTSGPSPVIDVAADHARAGGAASSGCGSARSRRMRAAGVSARLAAPRRSGVAVKPGAYDNRWVTLPQDFPSGALLASRGIRGATLIQRDGLSIPPDLAHVLRRWQDQGITLRVIDLGERAGRPTASRCRSRHGSGSRGTPRWRCSACAAATSAGSDAHVPEQTTRRGIRIGQPCVPRNAWDNVPMSLDDLQAQLRGALDQQFAALKRPVRAVDRRGAPRRRRRSGARIRREARSRACRISPGAHRMGVPAPGAGHRRARRCRTMRRPGRRGRAAGIPAAPAGAARAARRAGGRAAQQRAALEQEAERRRAQSEIEAAREQAKAEVDAERQRLQQEVDAERQRAQQERDVERQRLQQEVAARAPAPAAGTRRRAGAGRAGRPAGTGGRAAAGAAGRPAGTRGRAPAAPAGTRGRAPQVQQERDAERQQVQQERDAERQQLKQLLMAERQKTAAATGRGAASARARRSRR